MQAESGAEIKSDLALLTSKKTFRGPDESFWLILQRVSLLFYSNLRSRSFINFGIP